MSRFTIERTDVELESSFAPRLWALIHDVPVLYEALLDKLDGAGLSTTDLRPDPGDGSVGNAGLGFWLFGGKTNVRLGLDRVRLRSLAPSDLASPMEGVLAALQQVEPDVRFRAHTFEYACHGVVEGVKSADFVRQFVPTVPAIQGFGEHLGAGAAFYFGAASPVISSTLTLDASRTLQDGLFVRVFVVVDETAETGHQVQTLGEAWVRAVLASLSLEIE